jgi:hypothetical protein
MDATYQGSPWFCSWMGFSAICFESSDGMFGRFDLAALRGCHTIPVCLLIYSILPVLKDLSDSFYLNVSPPGPGPSPLKTFRNTSSKTTSSPP